MSNVWWINWFSSLEECFSIIFLWITSFPFVLLTATVRWDCLVVFFLWQQDADGHLHFMDHRHHAGNIYILKFIYLMNQYWGHDGRKCFEHVNCTRGVVVNTEVGKLLFFPWCLPLIGWYSWCENRWVNSHLHFKEVNKLNLHGYTPPTTPLNYT